MLDKRRYGLLGDKTRAACCDHDGIEHDIAGFMRAQAFSDNGDDVRGGDHADLHGVGADILEHGVDLGGNHSRVDILHRAYAARVLGRDGGDSGFREQTVRLDGFDIGLDAGTAAGIRTRDAENRFHANPLFGDGFYTH